MTLEVRSASGGHLLMAGRMSVRVQSALSSESGLAGKMQPRPHARVVAASGIDLGSIGPEPDSDALTLATLGRPVIKQTKWAT